jgi:hypothetical protein
LAVFGFGDLRQSLLRPLRFFSLKRSDLRHKVLGFRRSGTPASEKVRTQRRDHESTDARRAQIFEVRSLARFLLKTAFLLTSGNWVIGKKTKIGRALDLARFVTKTN